MNLLDCIHEVLEFQELGCVLNDIYNGKKKINYDKFKKLLINFGLKVMKSYLERNNLNDQRYSFKIQYNYDISGSYYGEINEIVVSDFEIRKLYKGDLFNFLVVFHELSHFKINCDLVKENYNLDLLKILKEKILSHNIDFYYAKNYRIFKEEVCADLLSIQDFIMFLEYCNIKLSKEDYKLLEKYLKKLTKDYQNEIRDFTYTLKIKEDYLTLEEAFLLYLNRNPKILNDYPFLNIEYYYQDGKILKRSVEELVSLYALESDLNKKKLIKEIIVNDSKNILKEFQKRK